MMEQTESEDLAYEAAMAAAISYHHAHPDAASYSYDKVVLPAIREHCPDADRELYKRMKTRAFTERRPWSPDQPPRAVGAWAIYTVCDSTVAWMTPGFAEAKRNNDLYGS
jgi:hypothetical protein